MTNLVWFKNDLRLHDNEVLSNALKVSQDLIYLYCLDPQLFQETDLGIRKTGANRLLFLEQSINDLKGQLEAKGAHLLIKIGRPSEVISNLVKRYEIETIFLEQEFADEELKVLEELTTELGETCKLHMTWGRTLYHKDDIPFTIDDIPLTSKAYRIPTGKQTEVRPLTETPQHFKGLQNISSDEFPHYTALGFRAEEFEHLKPFMNGGEREAKKRLQFYLFESEQLTSYRWTRNRSQGMDYSSKFSPYLALGCLSPRLVYHEIKRYEVEVKKNASTWWLVFELVWRDYFTFKGMRVGNAMYSTRGFKNKSVSFSNDRALFKRWCQGQTGIPFIDAHMRQLNRTGFMSNRGRVNCASYLIHDLSIDWTWGAAYFENRLIDYDAHVNWLNWHTQAFEIWYTNPVNQSIKYNAIAFIREWVPELEPVDSNLIHIPWHDRFKASYPSINYPEPAEVFSKWTRAINKILKSVDSEK